MVARAVSRGRPPLTAERLRQLIDYNPESGIAYWRVGVNLRTPGGIASKPEFRRGEKVHIQIKIDGRKYTMGRLAFLYMTGEFPKCYAEHKDRDKHNNKWDNLRDATPSQNAANHGVRRRKRGGLPKGVIRVPSRNTYQARICSRGMSELIGEYLTPEDAGRAYARRAKEVHGEFAYIDPALGDIDQPAEAKWSESWRGRRVLYA